LSRFLDKPGITELRIADRVFQYLSGTAMFGITFDGRDGPATLESYSDSDWAGDALTRRSISGGVVTIGLGANRTPIFWRAKQQATVALSSTEAELV
jgi:hypothetical protein